VPAFLIDFIYSLSCQSNGSCLVCSSGTTTHKNDSSANVWFVHVIPHKML